LYFLTFSVAAAIASGASQEHDQSEVLLRTDWAIESSSSVHDSGAVISLPGFNTGSWYPATIPSTVLSALERNHCYPDPYVGMNLRAIPGTTYPVFSNFTDYKMPPDSPFRPAWWYRTEFDLPGDYHGKTLWLEFDGINYRADVWVNGRQIATSDKMAGTWRLFEYDITAAARPGQANALAVEVFPPQPRDLALTLVDWAPMPPDKEMGIWRDVHIRATGPVLLRFPAVTTKLNLPSTDLAELTVRVQLENSAAHGVEGILKGRIDNVEFAQPASLGPHQTAIFHFTPDRFPQLKLANPRVWWPAQVGPQNLYALDLRFEINGEASDVSRTRFGIRQVSSRIDEEGHRLFQINGKNILIRGAGYSFDLLLRSSPERQQAQLKYVRDLNLNAIRLEGKLEDDSFFDLCDQMGILVMPGWCCCDEWENWSDWDAETELIAAESVRDQIRRLERHPSVFTWLNGSDFAPPPKIEKMYLQILKDCDWPNPSVSSASDRPTTVGPSGVKMSGPYEYVAPSFWYLDKEFGGAFGFNTETSPGPAIPPIETLRRMLPPDHLWPIDSVWEYHAGGMSRTLNIFTQALANRYGPSSSVEEFSRKAQMQAYEAYRAMMEAYGRNKYTSTGIIEWMLNNAWPGMIWHLYDWYLRPGGSYFGVKKACEPLHVQYSYDDRSIVVVNSYYQSFAGLKVTAEVYNLDSAERFSRVATVDVGPDSSTRLFVLPNLEGLSSTYFVNLTLETPEHAISRNFYWLSTKPETLDWEASERDPTGEYHISTWTPTKTFADYTALNTLPEVDLDATAKSQRGELDASTTVTLHNPSPSLAFAVRLKVDRAPHKWINREESEEREILPVLWQDNYFSLLPGETREVTATYSTKDLGQSAAVVEVEGWNVKNKVIQPEMSMNTEDRCQEVAYGGCI
jgi:exo-1,4-beta-D-glucosaminidase